MTNATDKQIYFLKSRGIDASNMTKETASELISQMKENSQSTVVKQPQVEEFIPVVKPGQSYKKPFDNTSYYVAYAKDLCVALIDSGYKYDSPENIMDVAIEMIKRAKAELQ